jgi:hypothetical protein
MISLVASALHAEPSAVHAELRGGATFHLPRLVRASSNVRTIDALAKADYQPPEQSLAF